MKITSVNLDDESEKIAEHIPNLSSFVRSSLKRWANQHRVMAEHEHLHWRENVGCCWPFSSRGLCHTCWPDGPPSHIDWKRFNHGGDGQLDLGDDRYRDLEWLTQRAREHSEGAEINLRDMHFNRLGKTDHDQQTKRGFFARLWAILGR